MARVVALVPDLMFGSRVLSMLQEAGHDVALCSSEEQAREAATGADVLVVDLTSDVEDRVGLGGLEGVRTMAFYSHVEVDVRRQAEAAGFDLVVPRSRMAREGAQLVGGLAGGA